MSDLWCKDVMVNSLVFGTLFSFLIFGLPGLFAYCMGQWYNISLPIFINLLSASFNLLVYMPLAIWSFFRAEFTITKWEFFAQMVPLYWVAGMAEALAWMALTYALRFTSYLSVSALFNGYIIVSQINYYNRFKGHFELWRMVLLFLNLFAIVTWCISDFYQQNVDTLMTNQNYLIKEYQPILTAVFGDLLAIIGILLFAFANFKKRGLEYNSGLLICNGLCSLFTWVTLIVFFLIFELDSALKLFTAENFSVTDNQKALGFLIGFAVASIYNYTYASISQSILDTQTFAILILAAYTQAIIYQFAIFSFDWNAGHILAIILFFLSAPVIFFKDSIYSNIENDQIFKYY